MERVFNKFIEFRVKLPIKIFILGSCVSRDPFEIAHSNEFEIVAYYARTSLASLAAPPYIDDKILNNIVSKFQRRMVLADMQKTVLKEVETKEYDILLIDLIDERFDLSVSGKSLHTMSNEYKKSLYFPNNYKTIGKYSDKKFEYWKKGFDALMSSFDRKSSPARLIVNKAYWTEKSNIPGPLRYSTEKIQEANDCLDLMYRYISRAHPEINFIEHGGDELISDAGHRWGHEPFHYIRAFSEKQIKYLLDVSS